MNEIIINQFYQYFMILLSSSLALVFIIYARLL